MLRVEALRKAYGSVTALANITAEFPTGSFTSVVGPSGCGKTTLLKCLSGLMPATAGRVLLDNVEVTAPPEKMALVFQDYSRSLYPWMTVRQNVAFPLVNKRLDKAEIERRVGEAVASVNLSHAIDRYPWQLSGGMQQRTAIARAIAYRPQILLMDEPFASVDAQTRADLEDLMLRLKAELGMTIVFVTHDIDESVYLGDRIVVLGSTPTEVKETLSVDLPSPRDQIDTKAEPEFLRLRSYVYTQIMHNRTPAAA